MVNVWLQGTFGDSKGPGSHFAENKVNSHWESELVNKRKK